MGFDPIQHAMCEDTAKQAAKSQRVGGVDKHRISVRMGDIDNADFNVGGIGFTKISPLMPTKEEIAKGTILCVAYDPNTGEPIYTERLVVSEVLFDDGTVYGVRLDIIGGATLTFPIFMAVAYRTGSWYDEEITETGIYLHVSGGVEPETRFTFEYETVHPIDPKVLPGVTLNLCDYGVNAYELIAKGTSGGYLNIEDAKALHDKIPTDDSRITLVTDDGENPILFHRAVDVAVRQKGTIALVCAESTMIYANAYIVTVWLGISFGYSNADKIDATVYYTIENSDIPTTEVS